MEFAGWIPPGAEPELVIRGDLAGREYVALWHDQGRVLAGMNVNVWDTSEAIQELVRSGVPVDPARLADPAVPLTELANA
jgi:3-phenylpropionate/trans-cinnamate dioxygenase ferredoxin reductase subunit